MFLADRNNLIEQTISGDFKPFGGKMTRVENRTLDSAYEVYLSLYHQLSGEDNLETFKQFKPNFFDLIVIDECHRGSAKEDTGNSILLLFIKKSHNIVWRTADYFAQFFDCRRGYVAMSFHVVNRLASNTVLN